MTPPCAVLIVCLLLFFLFLLRPLLLLIVVPVLLDRGLGRRPQVGEQAAKELHTAHVAYLTGYLKNSSQAFEKAVEHFNKAMDMM